MKIKSMVAYHGVVYLLSDSGKIYHFKINELCYPEPMTNELSESNINDFEEVLHE